MKTGFWDRVLVYLYVLITVALVAATMLTAFGLDVVDMLVNGLSANMPGLFWRLILIGICVLVIALGIYVGVVITPSRKKKSTFVTLNSDNGGEVRVSLSAIREMAGQAIRNAKGLEDVVINITEASDAIEIAVAMDIECGVHVPTVTMNMQRAIKTNIERNCGINVRSVTVDVRNVLPGADGAQIEEVEVVPVVQKEAKADEPALAEEVYLAVADEAPVQKEEEAEEPVAEEPAAEEPIAEEEAEEAAIVEETVCDTETAEEAAVEEAEVSEEEPAEKNGEETL